MCFGCSLRWGYPKVECAVRPADACATQRRGVGLVSTLTECQAEIAARMRRGDTFASVEEQLIDPGSFSEREKAALWLFGWSFVNWRRQRREAVKHIEMLARDGEAAEMSRPPLRLADVSPAR